MLTSLLSCFCLLTTAFKKKTNLAFLKQKGATSSSAFEIGVLRAPIFLQGKARLVGKGASVPLFENVLHSPSLEKGQ